MYSTIYHLRFEPEENWLRAMLLFYDTVHSIVPDGAGYHQRLSRRPRSEKRREDRATEHLCRQNGHAARAVVRPLVARYLGAGRLRSRTLEAQGLALPAEALKAVAAVPYAAGVAPYLPLLPLITDRHVDALTLAGTIEEVADHVVVIVRAGIDGVIIRPFAPESGTIEDTIVAFGSKVWPRVMNSIG